LAEVMIHELAPLYEHSPDDIKIEIIGTKPGEKMYEELMNQEETRRALELKRYFVVQPAFNCKYREINYKYADIENNIVTNPYNSNNEEPLSKHQLAIFLKENNLLVEDPGESRHPAERHWPNGNCIHNT
jgi:FlaA1/EpsC-like NDP-sugar epimerase